MVRLPLALALPVSALLCTAIACGQFGATDPATVPPDSGSPEDSAGAATDGAGGGDGGVSGKRFCADHSAAQLCVDFDDPVPPSVPFGFTSIGRQAGGGAFEVDEAAFTSSPRSLLVKTQTGGGASLQQSVGTPPAHLAITASLRLDELSPHGVSSSHFIIVRCANSSALEIYVKVSDVQGIGFNQLDNNAVNYDGLGHLDTKGPWVRVGLDLVKTTGDAYKATVSADGSQVVAPVDLQALGCDAAGLVVKVGSELSGTPTVGDWVLRFDDVLIEWN